MRKILTLVLFTGIMACQVHASVTKVRMTDEKPAFCQKDSKGYLASEFRLAKKKMRLKGVEVLSPFLTHSFFFKEFLFREFSPAREKQQAKCYLCLDRPKRGPPTRAIC